MPVAVVFSRAQLGVEAPLVTVEVSVGGGMPKTVIVGLPETAVKESKDRIRGALKCLDHDYPGGSVIINLAPADLPKEGGRFDLPIAVGILIADGAIEGDVVESLEFVGELGLAGELRAVRGVIPALLAAKRYGRTMVMPAVNREEGAQMREVQALTGAHLRDVYDHLVVGSGLRRVRYDPASGGESTPDRFSDIRGQLLAKRAIRVAASGGHNILMMGPPGSGKTMLASRLPRILPDMTEAEALEAAAIRSVSRFPVARHHWGRRPFRSPHHTASAVALVGGGNPPRPGEVSLAHRGVLFLDELPEFARRVLEVLREPLESGTIVISRAAHQVVFPARFQLVAAMNPCPCGYFGDGTGRCACTEEKILRYLARISGPLLDRIDLHIDVPALPRGILSKPENSTCDDREDQVVQEQVLQARSTMLARAGCSNSELGPRQVRDYCPLAAGDRQLLDDAVHDMGLSARSYFRILKVARTIADMEGTVRLATQHIAEAIGYRRTAIGKAMARTMPGMWP